MIFGRGAICVLTGMSTLLDFQQTLVFRYFCLAKTFYGKSEMFICSPAPTYSMWTDGSANSHTNFAADSGLEAEHCCIKVGGGTVLSDILTWCRMSAVDEDQ